MCRYCNYESDDNRIFIDPLTNEYYLDIETMTWDSYDDDFFHDKEYINYCPWCGRKLTKEWDIVMKKKIIDYRKRHRRCKYCKYNMFVTPKDMYTPDHYICKAKDKVIEDWFVEYLPRIFCSCYELK